MFDVFPTFLRLGFLESCTRASMSNCSHYVTILIYLRPRVLSLVDWVRDEVLSVPVHIDQGMVIKVTRGRRGG